MKKIEYIYEDEDIIMISKQPGVIVHPTKGHPDHTIANGVMKYMADSGQSFDQLKYKYMAAMLSERYDVSVDSGRLATAIENDSLPFYILQLIGAGCGMHAENQGSGYKESREHSGKFHGFPPDCPLSERGVVTEGIARSVPEIYFPCYFRAL